ncbi:MAG: FAD-dependent monooxygenase [Chitinophagales bacterium]|nr:FAD-dependent monooxygenase [Chitinophagales bacterium]
MKKEVSILGAGLVGSLLAIYLAKRGYKVDVYERRGDMRQEKMIAGRSINLALSDRGWRGLEKAGLKEAIEKIAIPMHSRMVHTVDGQLNLQAYGKEGQAIYSVSRGELNKTLMNLADEFDQVNFHFNHFANHVDLNNNKISFTSSPTETKEIANTNFDLLFGSDGAFSSLRHSMQFLDRYNYTQEYIEHGYKELHIPAGENGEFKMFKNALHIWPRGNFMLIALPNMDGSFTCTLFFPFEGEVSFSKLKTENEVEAFFKNYFSDAIELMPGYKESFFGNPTSSLMTVKCFPWQYKGKACLIGDAAHAIVPFFGQGMNCGFEDCTVLNELMDAHNEDWEKILPLFEQARKPNADAILQLALNNFIEMRDLVADEHFLSKKKIEKLIAAKYPERYISPYQMVSFSNIPYAEAMEKGRKINDVLEQLTKMKDLESKTETEEFRKLVETILFG